MNNNNDNRHKFFGSYYIRDEQIKELKEEYEKEIKLFEKHFEKINWKNYLNSVDYGRMFELKRIVKDLEELLK